ncbi:MAG TPA: peptidoglycan DD-metalloendopeptidase family protein [Verrucomicrobiae bacterium]|nr:peptidoglycan DD-metalloendopeptidase family protein [Verrucomicrobiae bacterium]
MRLDYSPAETAALPAARRSFLVAALVLMSVGAIMTQRGASQRSTVIDLADALPVTTASADPEALATPTASPWVTVKVKSGQTLSSIFDAHGLPTMDWVQIVRLGGDAGKLKRLKAGEELHLRKGPEGIQELTYALDEARTLQVTRTEGGFESITLAAEIERRPTYAMGSLTTSLYESGVASGLPPALIIEMADIFGYDIDFVQDIRVGDRFTVIYEELFKNGEKLRAGNILAAEFVNQGKPLRAVRYTDPQGNSGYYAPEGQSLRKSFIRTPVDVFRISSNFSRARYHPVLNRFRAHLGTDYAAPTGTPIKATGDGRVVFAGNKGGYGKAVVIRHGSSYETLYGHLSRFRSGVTTGSRVQQGQVIGYVGKTGLATGPHLHYEFRVNGVHRDPRRVTLPRASALPRQHLEHFRASSTPLITQLDALNRSQIAHAN